MKAGTKQLWKVLGTTFGVAVTLGGTIGTGILRKPGPIAASLHDPILIISLFIIVLQNVICQQCCLCLRAC